MDTTGINISPMKIHIGDDVFTLEEIAGKEFHVDGKVQGKILEVFPEKGEFLVRLYDILNSRMPAIMLTTN